MIVTLTVCVVPSVAVYVMLSARLSPTSRNCTAALFSVYVQAPLLSTKLP